MQSLGLLDQLRPILATLPQPIYLVGGAVRDLLLNQSGNDLDFAVPIDAIEAAFTVANALGRPAYVMDRERDVARIMLPEGVTLDFAGFRNGGSLEADLQDRDFTINAIALDAKAADADYFDPTNGLADLENGIVRMTHVGAIEDDPARALRAIRMAQKFGFVIEKETQAAVKTMRGQLWRISAERVRDEFVKLISLSNPDQAINQLNDYGLLDEITPEITATVGVTQSIPHHEDVFGHTLSVLRELSVVSEQLTVNREHPTQYASLITHHSSLIAHLNRPIDNNYSAATLLRFAALFHDCGKPKTCTVDENGRIRFFEHEHVGAELAGARLRELKFSGAVVKYVKTVVKHHMRPFHLVNSGTPSRRAIFRYFKATGDAGVDIAIHALADHLARDRTDDRVAKLFGLVNTLLKHYFEEFEQSVQPPKLVDGGDLIRELGMKPGREIGRILAAISESQATGQTKTREEALSLARQLIRKS